MRHFLNRLNILVVLFVCIFASIAGAQENPDEGLYDPVAPKGSAFIRFINVSGAEGAQISKANDKHYLFLDDKAYTPYYPVPAGETKLQFGKAFKNLVTEEGTYYTAGLFVGERLDVIQDPSQDNKSKAQIIFYNLSDQNDLSLKLQDGSIEIISPRKSGEMGNRELNPVKLVLSVYKGEDVYREVGPASLQRGATYSIIALNETDNTIWIENKTDTTR